MKNYYYILGISNTADENTIRTAYKKLSMLFHPDRNGGDKFFEDRFKEIQEAYDTLSNSVRRSEYDEQMRSFFYAQPTTPNPASFNPTPPSIYQFEASKKAVAEGELLTLTWQTANADSVHLDPLGMVEASGTKTIRLPNMLNRPQLTLTLTATNTFIQKNNQRRIQIQNKSYRGSAQFIEQAPPPTQKETAENTTTTPPPTQKENTPPPTKNEEPPTYTPPTQQPTPANTGLAVVQRPTRPISQGSSRMTDFQVYVIVAIMAILMVVMASVVYQLNFAK